MEFETLDFSRRSHAIMLSRAIQYEELMQKRRTVRDFSSEEIPRSVIEKCLLAAGSAPSGANLQPWHYVVVEDPSIKAQIRNAAELEEKKFYENKAPLRFLNALAPLSTSANKPHLEEAPILIVAFAQTSWVDAAGIEGPSYYPVESMGISVGILISALHFTGLATLTHTPNPMRFLNQILGRPLQERPFVILAVGLPKDLARVPKIKRKTFDDFVTWK